MGTADSNSWSRIQQGFKDTERLLGQQQFNMAMVKARQTLETMVKSLGDKALIVEGDLADNIDQLYEGRWISQATKDNYHRIRVIGNKAVHDGDESSYDANEAYQLLSQEVQAFANSYSGGRRTANVGQAAARPTDMETAPEQGTRPMNMGAASGQGARPVNMGGVSGQGVRPVNMGTASGQGPRTMNMGAASGQGSRPANAAFTPGQGTRPMNAAGRQAQGGAGSRASQMGARADQDGRTVAGARSAQDGRTTAGARASQDGRATAGARASQDGRATAGARASQDGRTAAGTRNPQGGNRAAQTRAGQAGSRNQGRPAPGARSGQGAGRPGSGSNHSRRRAKKNGFDPYDLIRPGLILLLIIVIVLLVKFIFFSSKDEKETTAAPTTPEVTTEAVIATEAPTTEAPTEAPKIYKTTTRLNVRTEPSTSAGKLGTLAAGTVVEYVRTDGEWTVITFEGREAYVSSQYLSAEDAPADAAGEAAAAP